VSKQECSKSIIGIVYVDWHSLCLPVPPSVVADRAPPRLHLLNACLRNIGLAVERTNRGLVAEDAKIRLDAHVPFPPVARLHGVDHTTDRNVNSRRIRKQDAAE
jgi:hypothetical protein